MLNNTVTLLIVCFLVFAGTFGIAFAASPDDSPDSAQKKTYNRKGGDMYIMYYGYRRGAFGRTSRGGSVGNRSFSGGGLRGGK